MVRSLRGFPEGLGKIWGLCGSWGGGASVEILVGLGAVELSQGSELLWREGLGHKGLHGWGAGLWGI